VHTPEGMLLPPNTLAELQRDMARLGFVVSQIREIEEARQKRLERQHETGAHDMVRQLPKVWHASLDRSRGQPRFFSYSERTVRTKSTSASRRTRGPGLVSSRPRGLHLGTYGSARWGRKFA
jgi:hypothetical protein